MPPKAKDSKKATDKEALAEKPKKRAKKRVLGTPFCEYLEKIRTARENAKTASEIGTGQAVKQPVHVILLCHIRSGCLPDDPFHAE